MTIQVVKYTGGEQYEVAERRNFATVEEGMAWAETERGAKLQWNDTHLGFAGMTEAECEAMANSEWPPIHFELHGVEDDGAERELEDGDFATP